MADGWGSSWEDWAPLAALVLGGYAGSQSGDQRPATTTTNALAPWQEPYVRQALAAAQQQFMAGPQLSYPGSGVAPLSQTSINAIAGITNPANVGAYESIRNYLMGQANQPFSAAQAGMGDFGGVSREIAKARGAPVAQQGGAADFGLQQAAARAAGLTASTARAADSGEQGYISRTLGGQYLNANPYLDAAYEKASRSVRSGAESQFASGGRLRSGAAQRALVGGLSDLATDIYGKNYETERGRMAEAANLAASRSGQLNQVALANAAAQNQMRQFGTGQQIGALQNLGQRQDVINAANVAARNAQSGQLNQAAINAALQQAQTGTNVNLQNAAAQNAMRQFGANYNLSAAQGAQGAQDRILAAYAGQQVAGGTLDQYAQRLLSDQMARYGATQAAPWQNIGNYLGAVTGNYGATRVQQQPSNTWANILGGAATGLGVYGQLFGQDQNQPVQATPQAPAFSGYNYTFGGTPLFGGPSYFGGP